MPEIVEMAVMQLPVPRRQLTLGLLALLAVLLPSLGCGAAPPSPPKAALTVSSPPTGIPSGWKTVAYGGLQVSVPAGWAVQAPIIDESCWQAGDQAVQPYAYTRLVAASCPSASGHQPPRSNVEIGCLYGSARSGPQPTPTNTVVVQGVLLRWSQTGSGEYSVTANVGSTVSHVDLHASPGIGSQIFRSVRPSSHHC